MRHVCLTPHVALSESPTEPYSASTYASKLALRILERPIILDYLEFTHGTPISPAVVPGDEDWWDTVDKKSYANVLARRHGKPTYEQWMAVLRLKIPDISTYKGRTVLLRGTPDIRGPINLLKSRNEIYEIKPNNVQGLKDATEKLSAVDDSYRKAGVSGIYRRGVVYPLPVFNRKIQLNTRFIQIFKYLTNLYLAPLNAAIRSISIDISRPVAGALLYKICVELDGLDNASKECVNAVARFAVRILSDLNTLGERQDVREAVKALALSLDPEETLTKPREWIFADRDFRAMPFLRLKPGPVAAEIAPQFAGIRDGMYSRLLGVPGERYLICADENWYRANVRLPGIARGRNIANFVGTADLVRATQGRNMIGVSPTFLLTAHELASNIPIVGDAARWLYNNPEKVLIFVGATVIITGLLIVTAGAATPLVAEAGVAAAVSGAVTDVGIMAAPVMGAAASVEAAGLAAVPVAASGVTVAVEAAAAAAPLAAAGGESVAASSLLNLTRALLSQPLSAAEIAAAGGERIAENILITALTSAPAQATLLAGAKSAAAAAAIATPLVLIGLCPSRAYAYDSPAKLPLQNAAVEQQKSVDIGAGRLFLLRVPRVPRYPNVKEPPLYNPFDADRFADYRDLDFDPNKPAVPKIGKLYMMGSFDVV